MSKGFYISQAESGAIRQGPVAPPNLEERPATAEWAMSTADNDLGLYNWIMRAEWLYDDFKIGQISEAEYENASRLLDHKIENYDNSKQVTTILGTLAVHEPPHPSTRRERKHKK
ncbi:MAG TPA: hypothetical protein VLF90_04000 [Patescibacteria group bacterium]|nr:hypothetical protein [Patescibacteria group bacterium]